MTIFALKKIFPYVPGEIKDFASLKKGLVGYWEWKTTKEILGWVDDKNKVALWMSTKHKIELLYLPNIPHTLRRMAVKLLEHLMGKLWDMHLEVACTIGHFYAMQVALTCSDNRVTAYLL